MSKRRRSTDSEDVKCDTTRGSTKYNPLPKKHKGFRQYSSNHKSYDKSDEVYIKPKAKSSKPVLDPIVTRSRSRKYTQIEALVKPRTPKRYVPIRPEIKVSLSPKGESIQKDTMSEDSREISYSTRLHRARVIFAENMVQKGYILNSDRQKFMERVENYETLLDICELKIISCDDARSQFIKMFISDYDTANTYFGHLLAHQWFVFVWNTLNATCPLPLHRSLSCYIKGNRRPCAVDELDLNWID